jgi:hypothetical protein
MHGLKTRATSRVPRSSAQLEVFIRRVHRRWLVWRALERTAVGLFGGCIFAAILYPILLWRAEPTMPMILAALGLGAACGLTFALKSRPSVLDAAIEADRQLKLHDLLASAISLTDKANDEWSAAVIVMATAKCASIAPRDVILNRFGARAWGGIGLSAAFLLTLGILSTNPIITQAVARVQGKPIVGSSFDRENRERSVVTGGSQQAMKKISDEPGSDDHSMIPTPSSNESNPTASASKKPADGSNGSGAGRSTTDSKQNQTEQLSAAASNVSRAGAKQAGAGGSANANASQGHDLSGANVKAQSDQSARPWKSSDWSASRRQALEDIHDGKTPAAYHDLIRDYFNRDSVDH